MVQIIPVLIHFPFEQEREIFNTSLKNWNQWNDLQVRP